MRHRTFLMAILLSMVGVLTCSSLGWAQIGGTSLNFDADLEWRTLTTDHFRIHFHNGLEGVAHHVAPIAEDAYTQLRDEFGEAPATIDLVLADPYDFANGFSNPISDQVAIFASQRDLSQIFNVRPSSWWETVVTHELVHSVDLRQTRGVHNLLERLFGNIIIPNAVKPIPFLEGLAVYEKHEIVGESRMNDSRTRMAIRQMVLDNDFPAWEEILAYYERTDWPSLGFLVYNYGAWLMRYVEATYGDDALQRFTDVNASKPLQIFALFGMGPKFSEIVEESFEVSPEMLYADFKDWLRAQFIPEIQGIRREGVLTGRGLTHHGFSTDDPTWSSRDLIAYTHGSSSRSGLRVMRADGELNTEVVSGSASEPAWSPDGRTLVYSRLDSVNLQSIRSDLYRVTIQTGSSEIMATDPQRLTNGERAYSPSFSPDGETLYYAKQSDHAGHSALMAREVATGEIRTVRDFADMGAVLQSFDVSPDGERFALALWRPGGYQDIYTMPSEGGELRPLTQNENEDSDPVFSPDGKYVAFHSDLDRRDNLLAIDLDSGEAFQMTNALSGAFGPTIAPDGDSLAYLGYDSAGYDVYRLPYAPDQWMPVELPASDVPSWEGYPTDEYGIDPYDPIPLMAPKLWLPTPLEGGLGITTMGNDPLLDHIYSVTVGWDFQSERPIYSLSYQHNGELPLTARATGNREQSSVGVDVTVPLEVSFKRDQDLRLGYERLVRRTGPDKGEADSSLSGRTTSTLSGEYAFNAVRQSERFGHSTRVAVTGDLINVETVGEWYRRVVLNWREGVLLPFDRSHVVALSVRGGWTDSPHDPEAFTLGGPTLENLMTGGGFSVRGFGPNEAQGQQAATASLQYDFPLFDVKRSVQSWPVFVNDVGGGIFIDAGMAGDTLNPKNVRVGFGGQLHVSMTLGYRTTMTVVTGIGQGIGQDGPRAYVDVQLPQLF